MVHDGNRTVQLALPCPSRQQRADSRSGGGGGPARRREVALYTSQSDSIAVYLQPAFSAVANSPRHQHHPYLIKYQGRQTIYHHCYYASHGNRTSSVAF